MAKKILIVEDDKEWQEALRECVEERLKDQVEIDIADNCKTGLQKLTDNTYHLVIIDIALVGDDDDNGMCLVRVSASLANIPVIIVTANISIGAMSVALKKYRIKGDDIFIKDKFLDERDNFINRVKEYIKESPNNGDIPDQKRESPNNGDILNQDDKITSLIVKFLGMLPVPLLFVCIYSLILGIISKIEPSIFTGNILYLWYILPVLALIGYFFKK